MPVQMGDFYRRLEVFCSADRTAAADVDADADLL
jgi:hypothetical protein